MMVGSIHVRLSSVDEASSFLRKSNSTFSWPICLNNSSFSVSACWRICSRPLPRDIGQPGQRLLLPPSHLGRVDPERLRDLRRGLVPLDGLHGHFRLQAGRMILTGCGH